MNFFKWLIFGLMLAGVWSACKKSEKPAVIQYHKKIGLVSGYGGFDDRGFNQQALMGLQRADSAFGLHTAILASMDTAEIRKHIYALAGQGFDLIIAIGFQAIAPIRDAALLYPDSRFFLIDGTVDTAPENLRCFIYRVDQSAFLCGFLAGYWCDRTDPAQPVAAWVGGPPVAEIENFRNGFTKGVQYFNEHYHRSVMSIGTHATGFGDTLQGARLADSLINLGAEVVFPFAGKTGNGALYQAKARQRWAIGVDLDQYFAIPEVSDILITSCLKKIDQTIYAGIKEFLREQWSPQPVYYGTLQRKEVDIAPFHQYQSLIPDTFQISLETVRTGIIDGTISTGWQAP